MSTGGQRLTGSEQDEQWSVEPASQPRQGPLAPRVWQLDDNHDRREFDGERQRRAGQPMRADFFRSDCVLQAACQRLGTSDDKQACWYHGLDVQWCGQRCRMRTAILQAREQAVNPASGGERELADTRVLGVELAVHPTASSRSALPVPHWKGLPPIWLSGVKSRTRSRS